MPELQEHILPPLQTTQPRWSVCQSRLLIQRVAKTREGSEHWTLARHDRERKAARAGLKSAISLVAWPLHCAAKGQILCAWNGPQSSRR